MQAAGRGLRTDGSARHALAPAGPTTCTGCPPNRSTLENQKCASHEGEGSGIDEVEKLECMDARNESLARTVVARVTEVRQIKLRRCHPATRCRRRDMSVDSHLADPFARGSDRFSVASIVLARGTILRENVCASGPSERTWHTKRSSRITMVCCAAHGNGGDAVDDVGAKRLPVVTTLHPFRSLKRRPQTGIPF